MGILNEPPAYELWFRIPVRNFARLEREYVTRVTIDENGLSLVLLGGKDSV